LSKLWGSLQICEYFFMAMSFPVKINQVMGQSLFNLGHTMYALS